MKAIATFKNADSYTCKKTIVRNLGRILNIRIIEIDIENGTLHFLYNGQEALEQVKKELGRIGHPIQNSTNQFSKNRDARTLRDTSDSTSARRPYYAMNR